MKYLKYFETNSQYQEYANGDIFLPNVSYVEDVKLVYYNPESGSSSDYVMVDLGLPSGLLWADRNIGAASPEDAGLYFQWGDTVGYTVEQIGKDKNFDFNDYFDTTPGGTIFNKYAINKLTVLEASDDAASVNMGSDWRMPTQAEMQELIDNTTPIFIDLQGNEFSQSEAQSGAIAEYNLKGVRFTGLNGNSIFIPASGFAGQFLNEYGCCGRVWLSDLYMNDYTSQEANMFGHNFVGGLNLSRDQRNYGFPVRGVK